MLRTTEQLRDDICRSIERIGRDVRLMEVCGTHTVAVFRHGLRSLFPPALRLISGPGCPVCVTAQGQIDAAVELARRPGVIVATYGDMVRVPGRLGSLEHSRAAGGRVEVVHSAMNAVRLAASNPGHTVVFLAVGFETTTPATAAAILTARRLGLDNFCVLSFHKRIVPAMMALLANGDTPLDGFLCPGHVSVIIGSQAYQPIVEQHARPCVVAGFEPRQILAGIAALLGQIERGSARLENVYSAVVSPHGNRHALALIDAVFTPVDTPWRGMGVIPDSGFSLRPEFARFDAARRFDITARDDGDPPGCRCGEVIQGAVEPPQCALFARACTPLRPIGPCMVSSEGTCAAWFRYGRDAQPALAAIGATP